MRLLVLYDMFACFAGSARRDGKEGKGALGFSFRRSFSFQGSRQDHGGGGCCSQRG